MAKARVGIYGGSFDPVHNAHLAVALAALEQAKLDHVLFVPAHLAPLKGHAPLASDAQRLAMLRLALMDEPRFSIDEIELLRSGLSYTADTLEALKSSGELFLILGADAAASFSKWKDPDKITQLATVLVSNRPGYANATTNKAFVPFDAPQLDLASSALRDWRSRGLSLRYLVPPRVWEYVLEQRLYEAPGG